MRTLVLACAVLSCFQTAFASQLETGHLFLGKKKVQIEIADEEEERATGLMYRKELKDGHGMLFVFETQRPLSFWMKNTFVPLSIGYFDSGKKLIDVQDMEPVRSEMQESLPSYTSKGPAMYALEVPKGWFQKNNIRLGTTFRLEKRPSGGR